LRPDPNFDLLISKIYPSRDEYEAHQTRVLEKLNKSHSQANLVQSINEGIKIQTQNRLQRSKKNQQDELNESSSSIPKTPSNNPGLIKDNVNRTVVQAKVAKKLKTVMISENDGPASLSADRSDITECDGSSRGVSVDEIELVFKPHPIEMGSDNQLIRVLKENSVRYIKTTANATGKYILIINLRGGNRGICCLCLTSSWVSYDRLVMSISNLRFIMYAKVAITLNYRKKPTIKHR